MSKLISSLWNPAGQLSQSAVSLLITLALAHAFSPTAYGWISVIAIVLALVMSMNRSVLGEQLLATVGGKGSFDGYWIFQRYLFAILSVVTLPTAFLLLGLNGALAAWFFVTFVASDAFRYALFAGAGGLSLRAIAVVDMLRAVTALLCLGASLAFDETLGVVVLAIASNLPWLVFAFVLYRPAKVSMRRYLSSLGRYEMLISAQFLIATSATQCLPIVSLGFSGPTIIGAIRLTQSLLNPIAVLGLAFQPTLIGLLSRQSIRDAVSLTKRLVLGALLIAGTIVIGAVLAQDYIVERMVPRDMAEYVNNVWIPIAVVTVAVIVGQPGGALIRVLKLGGTSLYGQVVGAVCAYTSLAVLVLRPAPDDLALAIAAGAITGVISTYAALVYSLRGPYDPGRISSPD